MDESKRAEEILTALENEESWVARSVEPSCEEYERLMSMLVLSNKTDMLVLLLKSSPVSDIWLSSAIKGKCCSGETFLPQNMDTVFAAKAVFDAWRLGAGKSSGGRRSSSGV